jgi:hypothetical protein
MASTRCWKCQERPSSRAGGLCYTCWTAAGKPDKERAEGLRVEASNPPAAPLSTDLADTLPSMRFVVSNPPSADTTHQHKSMREWRGASPTSFYGRLADLEKAELAGKSPPGSMSSSEPAEWNGQGECPCCHRGQGLVVGPDPKGPDIERLIEEFQADMAERMAR